MDHKRRNMSDYLAGLNGPAPEPKPEFDDTVLFQTTDFLNFEFDSANNFDSPVDNVSSAPGFAPWNAMPAADFNISDLGLDGAKSKTSSNTFALPDLPLGSQNLNTSSTASRRKTVGPNDPSFNLEERTRHAAEEDKRRRNTAASARFRVKKKQKEQALEKHAKDMQDKVSKLEKRVSELDTENKWLKGLLTDRPEGDDSEDKFGSLFAKFKEDRLIEGESD